MLPLLILYSHCTHEAPHICSKIACFLAVNLIVITLEEEHAITFLVFNMFIIWSKRFKLGTRHWLLDPGDPGIPTSEV